MLQTPALLPTLRRSLAIYLLAGPALVAGAVDIDDTLLLARPAIHGEQVVFEYAGDLWIADLASDQRARRLTSHPGEEVGPRFSPDGRWVAFTGGYDGNRDVYVVPSTGGEPRRLTWHPESEAVWGFTPDSLRVLFGSSREAANRGSAGLYAVALDGGFPERLPVPNAFSAAISPDGRRVAYNTAAPAFRQWKNYRGGRMSRIWIQDLEEPWAVEEIPRPAEGANDVDPMWHDGRILFRSDRAGEFNLWAYDPETEAVTQLTSGDDFPILNAASDGERVVFERAGALHLLDPVSAEGPRRLRIGVAADLPATRPRWVEGGEAIRDADISPSGARAVFEARGEIVTVPAEKGDPRILTDTPGAHERSPIWSPDGREIAWFSDASGEYALHVAPADGSGEARVYELEGAGFYDDPKFSPDGSKVSYLDNSWSLYVLDLESGEIDRVHTEAMYGPRRTLHHAWSPDSRWLAYTRITETYFQTVNLYSLDDGRSRELTEGLADVGEPTFDRDGELLYFYASTSSGPVRQWFAQSNGDDRIERELYLAVLPEDRLSPLAKESDEEPGEADSGEEEAETGGGEGKDEGEEEIPAPVRIDFEDLEERIQALPVPGGLIWNLRAGDGVLYYLRSDEPGGLFSQPAGQLMRFSLEERKEESLLSGVRDVELSASGEKILVRTGDGWWIAGADGPIDTSSGRLGTDAIRLHVDPRAEWRQIFHEAWRINRDYFYDPNMHGTDWEAQREKYAAFLPHLADRSDLNRVIRWLCSELAVGHHGVGGGDDDLWDLDEVGGGLLGADVEIVDGRYRFERILGGLNWNPELRSPLTEPGVDVEEGDFLLAVDGVPLDSSENFYSRFENTAGRLVELEVAASADGRGSRTVRVVPVDSERALRNRAWIEGNLRRVHEATDGRVAYVYVPDTTRRGLTYFKRYFYPQARKDAVIVDERFNRGGQVADYYIDLLRRPQIAWWTTRYGRTVPTPIAGIHGPKVMLINENAGSGGDLLPWMFRQLDLGTLIGKTTWGGLVGILGFPVLMDGGVVTAPNLAFWTPEEGYGIENEGVPPDLEVEQWPADVLAGRDPQLEKAIEVVLEKLEENPPPEVPEPPPFPVRARP